jgi:hypothetical protein
MKTIFIVVIAFMVLGFVFALRKRRGADSNEPWPFYLKKPLTPPEQILFHRLVAALPGHIVLAQVQLSRVLGVQKGFKHTEWNNRINRLSLDFVVCSMDATVIAAIELDDRSHEKTMQVERDARKEKALLAAGVHLIRWHVGALPDEAAIQSAVSGTPPLTVIAKK